MGTYDMEHPLEGPDRSSLFQYMLLNPSKTPEEIKHFFEHDRNTGVKGKSNVMVSTQTIEGYHDVAAARTNLGIGLSKLIIFGSIPKWMAQIVNTTTLFNDKMDKYDKDSYAMKKRKEEQSLKAKAMASIGK
jgi:hypothetical protein